MRRQEAGPDSGSPPSPISTHEQPRPDRGPDAAARLATVPDEELLRLAVDAQVTANAARARQLEAFAQLHARCAAEHEAVKAAGTRPWFVLTPGEETAAEFAPLLGITETSVEIQLHLHDELSTHFPRFWDLCVAGRLDIGKASLLLEAANCLADPSDISRFAELMDDWLTKHDDPDAPVVTLTRQQVQNAARYRRLKFAQKDDDHKFAEAFIKRRVRLNLDDNGMAHLGVTNMGTTLTAADYRLTLIAKKLCQTDDQERTLEQMRADVMVDLLLGRLDVQAENWELEEDRTGDDRDPAEKFRTTPGEGMGGYARPVINVTVPIGTLLGASDEPGMLSGDTPLPAEVVRRIAADPTSTWYRMLTDEAGRFMHLSTRSYHPTPPIWRHVVARHRTCIWAGCSRPAVQCDIDHQTEWPEGHTCTDNLEPLCKRHHKVKHADGFTITTAPDGTYTITTKRGSVFRRPPAEQPTDDWTGGQED
jgi:hypothetical protein